MEDDLQKLLEGLKPVHEKVSDVDIVNNIQALLVDPIISDLAKAHDLQLPEKQFESKTEDTSENLRDLQNISTLLLRKLESGGIKEKNEIDQTGIYTVNDLIKQHEEDIQFFQAAHSSDEALDAIFEKELNNFTCTLTAEDLSSHLNGTTLHQDTRDVERDNIVLDGELLSGAELKYEAVIKTLVKRIKSAIPEKFFPPSEHQDIFDASIIRFARCVLNAANRTTSGGAAFEVIMRLFGANEHLIITPDSHRAEPLVIDFRLDEVCFSEIHDFGIVAQISASTFFNLLDAVHVEEVKSTIDTTYSQILFLPLPLLCFPSRLSTDDGKSKANQKDYVDLPSVIPSRSVQYTISVAAKRR